jgi:hypothetical protein
MIGNLPSQLTYVDGPEAVKSLSKTSMRTDLDTMFLPLFPEDKGLSEFTTMIDGQAVKISSQKEGVTIATATDRKLLNLILARVSEEIQKGARHNPSITLQASDIITALNGNAVYGGSEYQRITERLQRLRATHVTATLRTGPNTHAEIDFSWLDYVAKQVFESDGVRRVILIQVKLTDPAFAWLTRRDGFEISQKEFRAITATRTSSWRVYEICLAHMLRSGEEEVYISLDDLKSRVPIMSELKVFKSRTLKTAMLAIANSPEMSKRVRLSLARKTDSGFEETDFSSKGSLKKLYVRVVKGLSPLPVLNQLIPDGVSIPPITTGQDRITIGEINHVTG